MKYASYLEAGPLYKVLLISSNSEASRKILFPNSNYRNIASHCFIHIDSTLFLYLISLLRPQFHPLDCDLRNSERIASRNLLRMYLFRLCLIEGHLADPRTLPISSLLPAAKGNLNSKLEKNQRWKTRKVQKPPEFDTPCTQPNLKLPQALRSISRSFG